jgi:hypothetical protein
LLTQRLLQHNQRATAGSSSSGSSSSSSSKPYNLAGYIVGNAVTDDATDSRGQVEYAYGLGLVDPLTYKATLDKCEVCTAVQFYAVLSGVCRLLLRGCLLFWGQRYKFKVTDDATDSRGQVEYAYGLGLVDPVTYRDTFNVCKVREFIQCFILVFLWFFLSGQGFFVWCFTRLGCKVFAVLGQRQ